MTLLFMTLATLHTMRMVGQFSDGQELPAPLVL